MNEALNTESFESEVADAGVLSNEVANAEAPSGGTTEVPDTDALSLELLGKIALCASILGSLFSNDPVKDEAKALVKNVCEIDLKTEWPFGSDEDIRKSQSLIREGAAADGGSIREEYKRQFIGPDHFEAPQWASVYLDPDEIVFGCAHLDLHQWMLKNGIESHDDPSAGRLPCDSAGKELLLLSWLANNRPELVNEFIAVHLAPWFSRYLELLEASSVQPFWKGIAVLAQTTLSTVIEELGIEVEVHRLFH